MENPEARAKWLQQSRASADKGSPLTFKETKKDSQFWSFWCVDVIFDEHCSYPLTLKGKREGYGNCAEKTSYHDLEKINAHKDD